MQTYMVLNKVLHHCRKAEPMLHWPLQPSQLPQRIFLLGKAAFPYALRSDTYGLHSDRNGMLRFFRLLSHMLSNLRILPDNTAGYLHIHSIQPSVSLTNILPAIYHLYNQLHICNPWYDMQNRYASSQDFSFPLIMPPFV